MATNDKGDDKVVSPTQKHAAAGATQGRPMSAAELMSEQGIAGNPVARITDSGVSHTAMAAGSGTPAPAASSPPTNVVSTHVNGGGDVASNMRAAIFSGANKRLRRKVIKFFGVDVEIRQQTLGAISELASEDDGGDQQSSLVKTIIRYAFVPGTDEKVFGVEHTEELMSLPFDENFDLLSDTIRSMTKVDVKSAEKNSSKTQAA